MVDERHPDAAFYLLPGDLVDRGHSRDDWDSFLRNGEPELSRRPLLPAIGNHETLKGQPPFLYRSFFQLPDNGPRQLDRGHAYHIEYGDLLLVVLDPNLDPNTQTAWLDETLTRSRAAWKVISFHHPLYSSHPKRNNDHLLSAWGPVIDKHKVDMVLQGHDHAYLRTDPMRAGQKRSPDDGTYYVVSVSGTKFYEQADRPYTAVGFAQTPTYQVLDVSPTSLHYRAFDMTGALRDEVSKRKPAR